MKISFYLKRPNAQKETCIYASISYGGYRLKYYLSEYINPKFWNKETQRAKQTNLFPQYPEFNHRLTNLTNTISDVHLKYTNDQKGKYPTPDEFKTLLDQCFNKIPKTNNQSFLEFFKEIIELSVKGVRIHSSEGKHYKKNTIKNYTSTYNHLIKFEKFRKKKILFKDIDLKFHADFTLYLTTEINLMRNSIGKYFKTIKTVLSEAVDRGIEINPQSMSKKFRAISENSVSIALDEKHLYELEKLDFTDNETLASVRDLFIIGCRTGARVSDWNKITSEQIETGLIEYTQTKTDSIVSVPIHDQVFSILKKRGGNLPHKISDQKINLYLKEIGKQITDLNKTVNISKFKGGKEITENKKMYELITTHTARRTFATIEYRAGTDPLTIMAITGHTTEKMLLKYIKVSSREHAKRLKSNWEERKRNYLKAV